MRRVLFILMVLALVPACVGYYGDPAGGDGASSSALVMECLDTEEYCIFDDVGDEDREEIFDGGCWITGGGHIGSADSRGGAGQHDQDSFGFNAMGMKAGGVRGELQNTTHLGDVFHGHATWLRCWKDEGLGPEVPHAVPNNAQWGGHGSWNHEEGYTWEAHLADRAEGGSHIDEYELWVYGPDGEVAYSQTAEQDLVITGGNFQIHPPNAGHPYDADTPMGL
ncbi:MAG: hypothetical protein DRJ42_13155 [Deltaproteobacteria bacterium]|nr:MAG: hypothetical protein DRJ42_13155 [Deltaproteobacteria bacterium]